MMAGIAVKGYMAIKAGRAKDAIMDQGLWLVLLPSIGLMATGSVLGETFAKIAKYAPWPQPWAWYSPRAGEPRTSWPSCSAACTASTA